MKAISHTQSFVTIRREEVKTIMLFRKSLLFNTTSVWIKREFDFTMGSFDDAEICGLVGVYILNVIGKRYGKERVDLYGEDDGSACSEIVSGPQAEASGKMLLRSLNKNSTSVLLVKQISKLSIF